MLSPPQQAVPVAWEQTAPDVGLDGEVFAELLDNKPGSGCGGHDLPERVPELHGDVVNGRRVRQRVGPALVL